ncbi:MAG: ATP-grasp domain-containing protein, partial [Gammaproteobacteria bacterium]|nr:ATP-grasp domain-containing protein [Gammaproteobacteria bacterium]
MRFSWRWLRINPNNLSPGKTLAKPGIEPGFVLLIAPSGSYRIAPYLQAAKTLGYRILVVSNSEHSLVPEVANGITVDFSNPRQSLETILGVTKSLTILCVIATDDSCVELASRVATSLKLPKNNSDAARLTHRKDLARLALQKYGCQVPEFFILSIEDIHKYSTTINYPVVVKPLALSASRGVIRANNTEQFEAACIRINNILESAGQQGYVRQHLLVEAYLDGPEFAAEGFMINREFHLLTIFDKPEPLTGPYFEETYYLTPSQLDASDQSALVDEVRKCCKAYGLEQGPVHAEARFTASGVVLLELAARTIGGQCGQLIEFSLQEKLEELVIKGMCGIKPELSDPAQAAGVLMIPVTDSGILKRVEGLTEALQIEFIEDIEIHIHEGYQLIPLPEGASYLGFIFAQAPTYDQVYQALKKAHQCLRFVTQPAWLL